MKIMIPALTAVCLIAGLPSVASAEETDFCVGPACVGHHDRDHWRHHDGFARDRGCKDITIHEDGMTKHIHKCSHFWR